MDKEEFNHIFINSILQDKIKIPAKYLSSNRQNYILKKLKLQENKCSKHGFIQKNSIEITQISLGHIDNTGLQGSILYNITYKAKVCNPIIGSILNVKIENKNQFGLLCVVKDEDDSKNILEIIVPKKSISIKSEYDLESLKIGDLIAVKLLGKKYHINDSNISGIGTVIALKTKISDKIELDNNEISKKKIEETEEYNEEDNLVDDFELEEDNEEDDKEDREEKDKILNEEETEDEDDEEDDEIEIDDEEEIENDEDNEEEY